VSVKCFDVKERGWGSWFRYYATSREVVNSISDLSSEFFIDLIFPTLLLSWGSTQPPIEMKIVNIPRQSYHHVPTVWKSCSLNVLKFSGLYRD